MCWPRLNHCYRVLRVCRLEELSVRKLKSKEENEDLLKFSKMVVGRGRKIQVSWWNSLFNPSVTPTSMSGSIPEYRLLVFDVFSEHQDLFWRSGYSLFQGYPLLPWVSDCRRGELSSSRWVGTSPYFMSLINWNKPLKHLDKIIPSFH